MEKRRGERGPDKCERKKRIYPVTVKMEIKLPVEIAQWVREKGGRKNSKFITQILRQAYDLDSEIN